MNTHTILPQTRATESVFCPEHADSTCHVQTDRRVVVYPIKAKFISIELLYDTLNQSHVHQVGGFAYWRYTHYYTQSRYSSIGAFIPSSRHSYTRPTVHCHNHPLPSASRSHHSPYKHPYAYTRVRRPPYTLESHMRLTNLWGESYRRTDRLASRHDTSWCSCSAATPTLAF